jgi:hypothetical protein
MLLTMRIANEPMNRIPPSRVAEYFPGWADLENPQNPACIRDAAPHFAKAVE